MRETCIQVAYTIIQESHMRNMTDDGDHDSAAAATVVLSVLMDL